MTLERILSLTPPRARNVMRRFKYHLLGNMSSADYWDMAARISAKAAICTDCTDEKQFFESGTREAALVRKKGLLGRHVHAIDIGCGIGRIENAIQDEVGSILGVDVSREMIKRARERVKASNVSFQTVDGCTLSGVPSAHYDLCLSFIVLQHIPRASVASYIVEVGRILKVGGHFLFQIPLRVPGREAEPPSNHPFGMRYYTCFEVENLLRPARLVLLERFNREGVVPQENSADDPEYEFYLARRLV